MNARDLTALVHLVGFTTGVVLYAMLGIMTRRQLTYVATSDARAVDRIPLVTAMLGIVWNVGAMVVYAARDFDISHSLPWVAAVSYTALGFLPAVVVHSTVRRSSPLKHRWYVGIAYAGSAAAGILQLVDAARDATPSSFGLLLLTITYAALLGVLAVTERRRPGFQQSITAVALAAFAVSALHLSRHAGAVDRDPWLMELIGHHASLPLVLAILYQDYRFAFADLFLKRALSLLALVIVVSLLYALTRRAAHRSARRARPPCAQRRLPSVHYRGASRALDRDSARLSVHSTSHLPLRRPSRAAAQGLPAAPR